MELAWSEIRRSKLRFGLLTAAVSLLVFLILFLSALSASLVRSFNGAIAGLDAQLIAYSQNSRGNLQASRLPPSTINQVRAVPGVASAAGLATATTRASIGNEPPTDVQVFGYNVDGPGSPTHLTAGRLPSAEGEAAIDAVGVSLGSAVRIEPNGQKLTVVGLLSDSQFSALPTTYVPLATFDAIAKGVNPAAPFVPVNAVAIDIAPGQNIDSVSTNIAASTTGLQVYTIDQAVAAIPGVESVTQTFSLLIVLTFVIGVVVIGFFFLILTVQKLPIYTMLRAIGAPLGSLVAALCIQIFGVVAVGSAIGAVLTEAGLSAMNTGIPARLDPGFAALTILAVIMCSIGAGLLSINRIRRIDPATAVGGS